MVTHVLRVKEASHKVLFGAGFHFMIIDREDYLQIHLRLFLVTQPVSCTNIKDRTRRAKQEDRRESKFKERTGTLAVLKKDIKMPIF